MWIGHVCGCATDVPRMCHGCGKATNADVLSVSFLTTPCQVRLSCKNRIWKAITRGQEAFEKGYNVCIAWNKGKMLHATKPTLPTAGFCDGSDLARQNEDPILQDHEDKRFLQN